jgi:hypothetical protein
MIHIVWRGFGLVAFGLLVPILASCVGMISAEPRWIGGVALVFSSLAGGTICFQFATRFYKKGFDHTLYDIPLEVWGSFYFGLACMITLCFGLTALKAFIGQKMADFNDFERIMLAVGGVIGFPVSLGTGILSIRSYRRKVMKTRAAEEYEDFEIVE